jgi:hypothetical protein
MGLLLRLVIGSVRCVLRIVLNVLVLRRINVPNAMVIWIFKMESASDSALINNFLIMGHVLNVMPVVKIVNKKAHLIALRVTTDFI